MEQTVQDKLKRFEEYKTLQQDLNKYFQSLENLTK